MPSNYWDPKVYRSLAHCNANNYFFNYNTRSGTALQAVPDCVYEKNWTLNNRPDKPNEIIYLSWKFKWVILIACRPLSVRPYVRL